MFDQLTFTNELSQQPLRAVALSLLASVFLSFLLVVTYRITTRSLVERRELLQGLALLSIVATMVMQAIGDSLARGLGMLGALSIIRFRTSLTSPRDMAFVFASLAAGIACGVFGFAIAFLGTCAFCLVAIALSVRRPTPTEPHQLVGDARVEAPVGSEALAQAHALLDAAAVTLRLEEVRYRDARPGRPAEPPGPDGTGGRPAEEPRPAQEVRSYRFRLARDAGAGSELAARLAELAGLTDQRLRFRHEAETT